MNRLPSLSNTCAGNRVNSKPNVNIRLRRTQYSHVQFYRDELGVTESRRSNWISRLISEDLAVDFPHSFCLHLLVVTSDNHLLLTHRSPKVDYWPNTWSASIEEQLDEKDLGARDPIESWISRALAEELNVEGRATNLSSLRVFSVLLEADIPNIGIDAIAELKIDRATLDEILNGKPRPDYEFVAWDFIELTRERLLQELLSPSRRHHPTTPYRLVHLFVQRFGFPEDSDLAKFDWALHR